MTALPIIILAPAEPMYTRTDAMHLLAIDIVVASGGTRTAQDTVHTGPLHRGEGMLLAFMVEQEAHLADPALEDHLDSLNPWRNRITFADEVQHG